MVKLLSPRAIAAAFAADQGRKSAPTSRERSGVSVGARSASVSKSPSVLGESMRWVQAITFGAEARMIAPGVGSVAAS